jgi:Sec-independent protein secretion pathway component TatC
MIVMTVPLVLLYFVSIGLAYIFGQKPSEAELQSYREEKAAKKKARQEASLRGKPGFLPPVKEA